LKQNQRPAKSMIAGEKNSRLRLFAIFLSDPIGFSLRLLSALSYCHAFRGDDRAEQRRGRLLLLRTAPTGGRWDSAATSDEPTEARLALLSSSNSSSLEHLVRPSRLSAFFFNASGSSAAL
jgi:hypothetical protein